MKALVNLVKNTRNEFWADGLAKKLADNFEEQAMEALTERLHNDPRIAIACNAFSFGIKAISFSDGTVILDDDSIVELEEWISLKEDLMFNEPSEKTYILIGLDDFGMCIKSIKPFIDELVNRGYKLLINPENDQLNVSFEMPQD